jgi:hypothetical protein
MSSASSQVQGAGDPRRLRIAASFTAVGSAPRADPWATNAPRVRKDRGDNHRCAVLLALAKRDLANLGAPGDASLCPALPAHTGVSGLLHPPGRRAWLPVSVHAQPVLASLLDESQARKFANCWPLSRSSSRQTSRSSSAIAYGIHRRDRGPAPPRGRSGSGAARGVSLVRAACYLPGWACRPNFSIRYRTWSRLIPTR